MKGKPLPGHEPYVRPQREVFRILPNLSWEKTKDVRRIRRNKIWMAIYGKLGFVPCFVCTKHVPKHEATLEHIKPLSKGGTDAYGNLTISHPLCNAQRGNIQESINA